MDDSCDEHRTSCSLEPLRSWQLGQVSLSTGVGMYYQHLIISIGPAVVSGHPAPDEHGQCIQTITDINK
jgi:hypothetical protein